MSIKPEQLSKDSIIQQALKTLRFNSLNAMQEAMLQAIDQSDNLMLLSPTGSGKTVGFLLPVLTRLESENHGIQVLVIAPSRELVIQIETVFKSMSTRFKANSCYGGHSVKTELNNFTVPADILIGTPGRLADHLRRKSFDPRTIKTLILDEFDKSLELGFTNEMTEIIGQLVNLEKRILTSATRATDIPKFIGMINPKVLDFSEQVSTLKIEHKMIRAFANDKLDAVFKLICQLGREPTLVFCNHREAVERLSEHLKNMGIEHDIFHGGLEQDDRERALIKFRNGSHHLLITTDLASRGLDIPEIKHIIHYQLPVNRETFIHRNGRTARMNAEGTSYLVLAEDERIPEFLEEKPKLMELTDASLIPEKPQWQTIYLGCGKKDKVNKIDIVGLFLQKGNLKKEELGLIEVLDKMAFVAVNRNKAIRVVQLLKNEKIKRNDLRIRIAR